MEADTVCSVTETIFSQTLSINWQKFTCLSVLIKLYCSYRPYRRYSNSVEGTFTY